MHSQFQSRELKIKVQKDLRTYLTYALPLCAILCDDRLYHWFYQHFVQLYTLTDENGNLWVDYLEDRDFYKDVAEYRIYDYSSLSHLESIMEFVVDKINEGYYVIIFIDEYYLPGKSNYQINHYVHQLMIYAYDNQNQKLKTIAFDRNQEFISTEYEYAQFIQAYEEGKKYYESSGIWVRNETVEIIRPREITNIYPFNLELFLKELKTYLLGQGEYSKIRPNNLETNGTKASFNFCVHDELIIHLNNLIDGKDTMDYRYVHLLFEHKLIMYDRLKYIFSNFKTKDELVSLLEEYSRIVKETQIARDFFIKQVIMRLSGIVVSESHITNILLKVKRIICTVKEKEQKVLSDIYHLL